MLKSKLHQARVTDANLEYQGSLGVSRELLAAAGMTPYEKVLVSNLENGKRLETYVIELAAPGLIVLNGAAAHKGAVGDRVIIMSFAWLHKEEVANFHPTVIVLDAHNRIVPPSACSPAV